MNLSKNQKNGIYIGLTVFFGLVVFFIVKHFKNKNTNNCIPKCNGKNCGDDGCKGNCGTCPSEQTCGQDGKCSGTVCIPDCDGKNCGEIDNCNKPCQEGPCTEPGYTCIGGKCTCIPDCDGKNCGEIDNCNNPCQEGPCTEPGYTCIGGKCNPNIPDTCYHKDEDPFGNPPGACSQNRLQCCDNLQFCFNKNTNNYVCRDNKLKTDICKGDPGFKYPDCEKIPDCKGSTSTHFCPCYQKDEDPFGNPPGACTQNRLQCCDDLQFCFNKKTNSYVCRDKKLETDICKGDPGFKYPDCEKIPDCKGSSQFCPKSTTH
jgi:hypothetical protein